MSQSTKYLLLGSLAILILTSAVALLTKQSDLFAIPLMLAVFLVVVFVVKGVIAVLMRLAGPPGEPPGLSGPTWRQVLVFLGSGVVLGGSTCFGAAATVPRLFQDGPW